MMLFFSDFKNNVFFFFKAFIVYSSHMFWLLIKKKKFQMIAKKPLQSPKVNLTYLVSSDILIFFFKGWRKSSAVRQSAWFKEEHGRLSVF